jgi:hypothetical protein
MLSHQTASPVAPPPGWGPEHQALSIARCCSRTLHAWAERGLVPSPLKIRGRWYWNLDALRRAFHLQAEEGPSGAA